MAYHIVYISYERCYRHKISSFISLNMFRIARTHFCMKIPNMPIVVNYGTGFIYKWNVVVGDMVVAGQHVCEIRSSSHERSFHVKSPCYGTIFSIERILGDHVTDETIVAYVEDPDIWHLSCACFF